MYTDLLVTYFSQLQYDMYIIYCVTHTFIRLQIKKTFKSTWKCGYVSCNHTFKMFKSQLLVRVFHNFFDIFLSYWLYLYMGMNLIWLSVHSINTFIWDIFKV